MSSIPIHDGKPWSPYFVFIKNTGITDRELMNSLGLQSYTNSSFVRSRDDYLVIGRDAQWTHIADNFGYTHWESKAFGQAVSKFGERFEVFTFSVGEADMSFHLHFYSGGQLIRRFIWEDHDYSGGRLKKQSGSPLEYEDTIPFGKDPVDGLWRVASALGIESDYAKLSMSFYAPHIPASQ